MLDAKETSDEELFRSAVMLVWTKKVVSTSLIQRHFGIGYNKAARVIERMESLAIVSAANHIGKREVRSSDDLRKALNIREAITDIAGDQADAILLNAISEGLKTLPPLSGDPVEQAADKARDGMADKARAGRPRMKPDPEFDAHNCQSYRVTADELRQFIERFERLEQEKKDIADQQKEVMAEAKARGYDTKVMRKVIALRKRDSDDVAEEQAVLEMYKEALGMA